MGRPWPSRSSRGPDTIVTGPPEDEEGPLSPLRTTVEQPGGHVVRLADGAVLAAFAGAGIATDLACHAASAALILAAALPAYRLAVATGRGVLGHARALAAAGDEDGASAALAIALTRRDEQTARILDESLRATFLARAPGQAALTLLAVRARTRRR